MSQSIADVVAIAVCYLENRRDETHGEDDDLRCLEDIAARFRDLGDGDRQDLIVAFHRMGAGNLAEGMGLLESRRDR